MKKDTDGKFKKKHPRTLSLGFTKRTKVNQNIIPRFCKVEKAVSSIHQNFLSLLCRFFSLCPHIFPYSIEGTAKSNDAAKQGSEQSWRFLRKDAQTFQQDSPFDRNLDYFFSTSFLPTSQNIAHLPPKSASKAYFLAEKGENCTYLAFFSP